jgi:CDP-diacylglycerol--glycerol-3-phosphate 3-phosphatidyltransferase
MNKLANKITLFRIAICFPVAVLLLIPNFYTYVGAFCLFLLGAMSDFLDGRVAQREGSSVLGKFLDPIADKFLTTTLIIYFTASQIIPPGLSIIFILRELSIMALRTLGSSQGRVIPAKKLGKLKTVLLMVGLGMCFGVLLSKNEIVAVVSIILLLGAGFVSLLSAWQIFKENRGLFSLNLKENG